MSNKKIIIMSEKPRCIAILGGSFDPPTIAHIQTASEIYNLVDFIDEVWLVPCGDNRSDKALKASASHRKKMLELAINDILGDEFSVVKVCDYEVEYGAYLPTYDLLNNLKSKYPSYKFYMSIGSDLVNGLKRWNNGNKLVRENEFIIICRESYAIDPLNLPSKNKILECNIYGSSTSIRNRIKGRDENTESFNIEGLTTKSVLNYIQENKLYM